MIWRARQAERAPVPMLERWVQAYRAGEVQLDPFTPAELGCVALDPEYLPADVRGPVLQTVTPLLAALQAGRHPAAGGPVPPVPPADPAGAPEPAGPGLLAGGDPALAQAAAELERLGYIRPGEPAPAELPVPPELAGWAVSPPGQPAGVRRVALTGDLGIITRMRAQPLWVVEVYASPEPSRPDLTATWPPVGRMYASWQPVGTLAERPAGPDGRLPPFSLVGEERTLQVMMAWCGLFKEKPRPGQAAPVPGPQPARPTAEVAGRFTSLAQLRVARSFDQEVRLSLLVIAVGEGRYWLLEGERGEQAVEVPQPEIAQRAIALLKSAQEQAEPAGQDATWPGEDGR